MTGRNSPAGNLQVAPAIHSSNTNYQNINTLWRPRCLIDHNPFNARSSRLIIFAPQLKYDFGALERELKRSTSFCGGAVNNCCGPIGRDLGFRLWPLQPSITPLNHESLVWVWAPSLHALLSTEFPPRTACRRASDFWTTTERSASFRSCEIAGRRSRHCAKVCR